MPFIYPSFPDVLSLAYVSHGANWKNALVQGGGSDQIPGVLKELKGSMY